MIRNWVFLILILAVVGRVQGQNLSSVKPQAMGSISPIAVVEMMEKQLGDQFRKRALRPARFSTARLTSGRKVLTHGTVLRGDEKRFCYLVFPADAAENGSFEVCLEDGQVLRPLPGTPVQMLSREDNLAIVRVPYGNDFVSPQKVCPQEAVGSFVGFLIGGTWNTGSITHIPRTAFHEADEQTQKALVKHWEKIALRVSSRRIGFPEVVETDLDLKPEEAGVPVFDRNGAWLGVAISRADRHSTYVIPATRVTRLVAEFEGAHQK